MIRKLIERLKAWARETAAALREKLEAAAHTIKPTSPAVTCARATIVESIAVTSDRGKWYRETGDHPHAPVFSLYTFFAQRQP